MTTSDAGGARFEVCGTVRDDTGSPVASGVAVEVSDLRLGGEHLVGAAEVAPDGAFALTFDPGPARSAPGASLDLVVRVVRAAGGPVPEPEVIAGSAPRFDAGPRESFDIVVPKDAVPVPDEYSRLVGDIDRGLAAAGPERMGLAGFVEAGGRRDVTFAAAKSGWDARAVAMASLADREAASTGIPAPLHYALYRAGLPAGQRLWALAPSEVVENVWARAAEQGIIAPDLMAEVPASLDAAGDLAASAVLDLPTGVGGGRLEDLLHGALAGEDDRRRFARLYREHRDAPETLWTRVREEFPDGADRLRLDGELAALTRNNAPLIAKLHGAAAPSRIGDLAAAGYHRADRWRQDLTPDVPVPDDVHGEDDDSRRDAYAAMLAEELRLRRPTAVLAAEVAEGTVPVGGPEGTGRAVAEFLADHHERFELAVHPIDGYLAAQGIDLEPPVRDEVAALQRIVAVAPNPGAVRGLRTLGFGSARSVAVHGETAFVERFGAELGGEDVARETFRRSDQVHSAAIATATSHLLARSAPEVFAVPRGGPAAATGPAARALAGPEGLADVRTLPNLETLFGPGDTGACEACESVLSPAAYLVDLLEFLDADPPAGGGPRPLEVLLGRRPDLQHTALSCENTEVELPYVDIVNEILEHVVVHASIDGYEGHDVGPDTSTDELLASPQFVDDAAYTVLRAASYPLVLPWDQRLAALRAYLAQADVTLADAMAPLAADDAGGRSWSDVVRERAGVGPAERDLLCGPAVTAQALYGDDPARVTEAQLVSGAGNARRLARRLGLTPADLVALLLTRFVNPDADLLVPLRALRVGLSAIKGLHDGTISPAQFRASLPPGLDTAPFGGDVVSWLASRHDRIMNIVVLTDPTGAEPPAGDSTGAFASLELRRALPDPARNRLRAVDLLAIARFVRLRDRLGWTIERTDEAVAALWPVPIPPAASADEVRRGLDGGFDAVLVRLGHLLTAADLLGLDLDAELPWLLGCFAPLGEHGPDAPYRRLFLTSTLLGADPVFGPGADGRPPASPGALLLDHAAALQAALKLTAEEFAVVAGAAGVGAATPLSVASISLLFRYGYLARALHVGVTDLVGLIEATGWKPFDPLDGPDPDFLKLVRLVQSIRDSGLPVGRLVTLARGTQGQDGAPDAAVTAVLRSVRTALVDPRAPSGGQWSDSALRTLLTSVFDPDVSDAFLGLLAGASTYTTGYHQDQAELPGPVRAAAPGLAYDATRSLLIQRGVLTPEAAAAVTALPGLPAGLADAVTRLVNAGQAEYLPLLRAHPVLARRWQVWAATPDDPADPDGEAKRSALGTALLEELRPGLRRRRLGEVLGAATGTDPEAVAAFVEDPVAMPGSEPPGTVGDDLAAVTATGLTARFWAGATAGPGDPARTAVAPGIDYGPGAAGLREAAGIPTGPVSAAWAGFVDPPISGAYVLSVEADGSAVTLQVDGGAVPLTRENGIWTAQAPVDLVAGRPARLELTATGLNAMVRLRWRADGVAQVVLPGGACCPADAFAAFTGGYRRLTAALELAAAFGLSVRELHVLARSPEHRVGGAGWLSAVPAPAGPAASLTLVLAVAGLARYRRLCERWAVTGTAMADLLDDSVPGPPAERIAAMAGVAPSVVDDVTAHLGLDAAAVRGLDALWRVADVLDLVRKVALPVSALARTLRTAPSAQDVRDVRDGIRARYDDAAWTEVVRPIHNGLRRAARDALVGRVLHQENPDPDLTVDEVTGGFTTPDQLYEKLLIDVQTDPCMTTSRIAQAISTVQLFVARVLLNLEPEVSPSSVDPQRWEAMKRYRVWEANRRVFLFPENWLDPELRDDKSPFFREVESELLQSDITDQAAATALGHYLERLDEVANLEIAGMHVEERVAAGTGVPDPVVHVIGRTFGAKRGYFHRTLDGTWRPWEAVNVDVTDDPVLPVIWKGRFLLFWLKVSKQPDAGQPGPFTSAPPGMRLGDLSVGNLSLRAKATLTVSLFWSEYYNGRWQSPRTSDPDRPIDLGAEFSVIGDPLELRLASEIEHDSDGVRDSLGIIVLNPSPGGTGNSYFRLYTTHSLPVRKQDDTAGSPGFPADRQFSTSGPLVVSYRDDPFHDLTVLRASQSPYQAIGPMHRLTDPHRAPFFFQDSRHVFYVHPDPTDELPPGPGRFGVFPGAIAAPLAFPDLDTITALEGERAHHG
ncbi:MAG TPA: neuraminidase-like domain-containing protein [Spirillospora sp.]|nr:neuraminidase-like domain-containing protein [Spirillospora sp.]